MFRCCLLFGFLALSVTSAPDPGTIKKVHVVFSNHLDVGFSDPYFDSNDSVIAYSVTVVNLYFHTHFPQILQNSLDLQRRNISYVYTTHPWLIWLYLHCQPLIIPSAGTDSIACPSQSDVKAFRQAILQGHVTWHAFPFNTQIEMQNAAVVGQQIKFVHDLDDEFGFPHKTVMSQRDVPGVTAGAISTLLANGVRAISVGVNTMSAPPAVPIAFRWQNPANSTQQIIGMWNPGGYGYYYINNCVYVPGWDQALAFYWRGDNLGPGNVSDVLDVLGDIKQEFPNAQVVPSTFESFVSGMANLADRLPLVKAEIGDTWIYGVASDPKKAAIFREIARFIEEKMKAGQWNSSDPKIKIFTMLVLKLSEHTWGVDQKLYLHDNTSWSNEAFAKVRNEENYRTMISSWVDQRNYIPNPKRFNHPVLNQLFRRLEDLELLPQLAKKRLERSIQVPSTTDCNVCGAWDLTLGKHADVIYLASRKYARTIFNGPGSVTFAHTTFNSTDVDDFIRAYGNCGADCPNWLYQDFGKWGLQAFTTVHDTYIPNTVKTYKENGSCIYHIVGTMARNLYGPPQNVVLTVDLTKDTEVSFQLLLQNKTATRMPEAFWMTFMPVVSEPQTGWSIHKVAEQVPALSAVVNGSRHLHGSWDGVFYTGSDGAYRISSLDAPIVSIGPRTPYPTPFTVTDPADGQHFLLWTNAWGTNYPLWYPFVSGDGDLLFRFKLSIFK